MDETYASVCRVCLNQLLEEKMHSIFNEDEFGMKISQKIADCSGIIIEENESLPTRICLNCYESLSISYKFRLLCLNSEKQLLMFKQGQTKFIHIKSDNDVINEKPKVFFEIKIPNCSYNQDSNELEHNNGCHTERGSSLLAENTPDDIKEISFPPKTKKIKRKLNLVKTSNRKTPGQQKEQPLHICEQCGNTYARRCLLSMHMRRHSNIKRFECELCEKKFQTQSEMARHMRTHTGVKPYMCRFCGRKFADRSTNIKHERTHTNERPFVCETCGKSFTYSNVLKNHILTHTGEKKFKCKPCEKTFSRAHQLKQHFGTLTHQQTLLKLECTDGS